MTVAAMMVGGAGWRAASGPPASVASEAKPIYRLWALPELSRYTNVSIVGIDAKGDILANVMAGTVRIHGQLGNHFFAVLDVHAGTRRARVVPLLPIRGMPLSKPIAMNASGTVVVESWNTTGRLFAGTLHGGRPHWNWLRFVPHYGSGSAVGIAANGDVAGEIHGLIRKPHCCKSLQQAVIWRPYADGSYRFPYFVPGAASEATAIWSDGKSGETIVAGKVVNSMAIWTPTSQMPAVCRMRSLCLSCSSRRCQFLE